MKKLKKVFLSTFLSLALLLGTLSGVSLEVRAEENVAAEVAVIDENPLADALKEWEELDADGAYNQVNLYTDPYNIKGMQGALAANKNDYGGLSHTLTNICLDAAIFSPDSDYAKNGWAEMYEFEGEKFYFTPVPTGMNPVINCNNSGMSISAVFLLRWNDGSRDSYNNNTNFLIDASSRVPGYTYYAPNSDLSTYGGRAIRAYWHYLMEMLDSRGCHIDNFILGNEVNMPNHWHYSGSTDVNVVATKYADAFYYMYDAVNKYTDVSRCSISIDHSWTHNDEGRGIGAKYFLHAFHNRLAQHSSNVDWCVSAHLYPAILTDTRIWNHPYGLTTNSSDTAMVDGTNLSAMTNYIRDTFGAQHRVMLTEQGFTNNCGYDVQAACLAYTYYAAMYDPMVDSFLLNAENGGSQLDMRIENTLAGTVYTKIGNGNAEDQKWIADVCLPIIGASSWASIIPNWGDIQSIVLPEKETVNVNGTKQLTASVAPSHAASQALIWTSSNPSVATVDANGMVTGVGAGAATITATAKYANAVSDSCTVTVIQPVQKIELNKQTLDLFLSKTDTLTATISPSNATNKAVLWKSSNTGVATVDANGKVTAVGVGKATITVTAQDGSGVSASCAVTVSKPVEQIVLSEETLALYLSETHTLKATVTPDDATNKALTWSSSNETVATVNQHGKVTALDVGTVTITATAKDGSGVSGSCVLTVSIEEGNPFYDVPGSKWYFPFALRAYNEGLMSGVGTHTTTGLVKFAPENSIPREQFVQILYNREGKPEVEYSPIFSDVPEQSTTVWYSNAIMWAAQNNLVSGYDNGKFGVGDLITREQVAVILKKYAAYKGYDTTVETDLDTLRETFNDVDEIHSWAADSMCWAVEYGVMSGKSGGWLAPLGNAQRAEAATMILNMMDAYAEESEDDPSEEDPSEEDPSEEGPSEEELSQPEIVAQEL